MTRFSRDFSRSTINSLRRKGIDIVGKTLIPGSGEMPMANGSTGYCVDDNGTHRVMRFREILEVAG
jgi:hypothetical protein